MKILRPAGTGSDYYNYKGFFSIVLLAVVGASAQFIYADVGCQGRISDGGVLRNTEFYKALEQDKMSIPQSKQIPIDENENYEEWKPELPFYFVGDDAFSLTSHIIKPYSTRGQTEEQRIFNYRLSRAKRVSENAFGILSSRFRVYHITLCVKPWNAVSIVHATLVLHNCLMDNCPSTYTPTCSLDFQNDDGKFVQGDWRQDKPATVENLSIPGRNHSRSATQMRDC